MSEVFENRDMACAVFRNVNLSQAVFDDVNLGGATIHNANLSNMSIRDANIRGLTIQGIEIDRLFEAELDRRDPERAQLRMGDVFDPERVHAVLDRLDEVRAAFVATMRAADVSALTTHPRADKWSAIEQVRHMIFAEDLYLNRWLLRSDAPWNPMGQLPAFLADDPRCAAVGSQVTNDLEAILAAWQALHDQIRAFAAGLTPETLRQSTRDVDFGQGTVGGVLQGMALHDLHHMRAALALIAQPGIG